MNTKQPTHVMISMILYEITLNYSKIPNNNNIRITFNCVTDTTGSMSYYISTISLSNSRIRVYDIIFFF